MRDPSPLTKPWLRFGGTVLVVAVLYWAQAVIVPMALALLLTVVLSPVVGPLQRRLGSIAAVLAVVVVTSSVLGLATWAVTSQLTSLVQQLPTYQHNVRQKVRDIRWLGTGSVGNIQNTVDSIENELQKNTENKGTAAKPVVVEAAPVASLWGLPTTIGAWLEPFATSALVIGFVIFMLLDRHDLRDRFISLLGQGNLAVTTRAFDEAGRRVSRYLIAQSLINLFYGVSVGAGLYFIGVPYAVLWAALAAALRFVPYFGPWIAAIAPLGLLMATPLTVCLVVVGKYVPGFEFVSTLLSDTTVLESHVSYYQRLLAGDPAEAAELLEQHLQENSAEVLYDAFMVPALNYAERDRFEGRLSDEEERAILESCRTLLQETTTFVADRAGGREAEVDAISRPGTRILGWPMHGEPDVFALEMLAVLLNGSATRMDILPEPARLSDGVRAIAAHGYDLVCIGDLPPSPPSKARYIVSRLRGLYPTLRIVVGRWAPPEFADDRDAALTKAGATSVDATLTATCAALGAAIGTPAPSSTPPTLTTNASAGMTAG